MTPKVLDTGLDTEIADSIIDQLEEYGGWTPEQIIPGLVLAIILLSQKLAPFEEQALDEAANLLADSGEVGEW